MLKLEFEEYLQDLKDHILNIVYEAFDNIWRHYDPYQAGKLNSKHVHLFLKEIFENLREHEG